MRATEDKAIVSLGVRGVALAKLTPRHSRRSPPSRSARPRIRGCAKISLTERATSRVGNRTHRDDRIILDGDNDLGVESSALRRDFETYKAGTLPQARDRGGGWDQIPQPAVTPVL
jgi:hypothetical protein